MLSPHPLLTIQTTHIKMAALIILAEALGLPPLQADFSHMPMLDC